MSKLQTDVDSISFIHSFHPVKFSSGTTLIGCIQKIQHDHLVINTIDNNVVRAQHNETSDLLHSNSETSDLPELSDLFKVGQFVICAVVGENKKKCFVSLRPSVVNAFLEPEQILPDSLLWTEVTSSEDHGYTLRMLGDNNTRNRLSGLDSLTMTEQGLPSVFLPIEETDMVLNVGQTLCVRASAVTSAGIRATTNGIAQATSHITKKSSVEDLAAMQLHKRCTIKKILPSGIIVSIKGIANAFVPSSHLPQGKIEEASTPHARIISIDPVTKIIYASCKENVIDLTVPDKYNVGEFVTDLKIASASNSKGAILTHDGSKFMLPVSFLTDSKSPSFTEEHAPGKVIEKAIIVKKLYMDDIYVVSTKPSMILSSIVTVEDVKPGMVITGTINYVLPNCKGFHIQLPSNITAFLPISHMNDDSKFTYTQSELNKLQRTIEKSSVFRVGNPLKLIVISAEPKLNRIIVSHKKSLVDADNFISSEDQIVKNALVTGFVSKILPNGACIVRFANNISAIVPKAQASGLTEGQVKQFRISQVIKEEDTTKFVLASADSEDANVSSVVDVGSTVKFTISSISKDNQYFYCKLSDFENTRARIHILDFAQRDNYTFDEIYQGVVISNSPLSLKTTTEQTIELSPEHIGRRSDFFIRAVTKAGVIGCLNDSVNAIVPFVLFSEVFVKYDDLVKLDLIHKVVPCRIVDIRNQQFIVTCRKDQVSYRTPVVIPSMLTDGQCFYGDIINIIPKQGLTIRVFNSYPRSDLFCSTANALDLADDKLADTVDLEEYFKIGQRVTLRIKDTRKKPQAVIRPSAFADGAQPPSIVADEFEGLLDVKSMMSSINENQDSDESEDDASESSDDLASESSESDDNDESEDLDWNAITATKRTTVRTDDDGLSAKTRRGDALTEEEIESVEMANLASSAVKSEEDIRKLIAAEPNNSIYWISLAAFLADSGEFESARSTLTKALQSVAQDLEADRINLWIALLNFDFRHSGKETFATTLTEARNNSNHFKLYIALFKALEGTDAEIVRNIYNDAARDAECKKKPSFWKRYVEFEVKNNLIDNCARVLDRAKQQLNTKELSTVLVDYFKSLFTNGHEEAARTEFEKFLANNPKRTEVWSMYADLEVNAEEYEKAKQIWDHATALTLSKSDMKFIYKKAFEFASMVGDEEFGDLIKQRAVQFAKK